MLWFIMYEITVALIYTKVYLWVEKNLEVNLAWSYIGVGNAWSYIGVGNGNLVRKGVI